MKKVLFIALLTSVTSVPLVKAESWWVMAESWGAWSKQKIGTLIPPSKSGKVVLGMAVVVASVAITQLFLDSATTPVFEDPILVSSTEELCEQIGFDAVGNMCFCSLTNPQILLQKFGIMGEEAMNTDLVAILCSVVTKFTYGMFAHFIACMDPQKAAEAVRAVSDSGQNMSSVCSKNFFDYCQQVWDAYRELP